LTDLIWKWKIVKRMFHQIIHVHELWWLAKVQQHAWCMLHANHHICKGKDCSWIDSVGKYPVCLGLFLTIQGNQKSNGKNASVLTRKRDAIQHKMATFAWWRNTKRNILIKPSLRCSLKPIWRHLTTLVRAPLLVLRKTKWYISRVGTTFLRLASMLSNRNSEPSTITRWDVYFFDKES
jgi:hypothetical protein